MTYHVRGYGVMELNSNMSCCAVDEIDGLEMVDDPLDAMQQLLEYGVPRRAFLIFTAAAGAKTGTNYGHKFAAFIVKNKLGTVTESPAMQNPNTNRYVTVFTWALNRKTMETWRKKHPYDDEGRDLD